MRKVIYRFHWYNNLEHPYKFLIRENSERVALYGWGAFMELCFDAITTKRKELLHVNLLDGNWETVFIDMDKLKQRNLNLYFESLFMLNEYDWEEIVPSRICNWLDGLEDFVCGKVVGS